MIGKNSYHVMLTIGHSQSRMVSCDTYVRNRLESNSKIRGRICRTGVQRHWGSNRTVPNSHYIRYSVPPMHNHSLCNRCMNQNRRNLKKVFDQHIVIKQLIFFINFWSMFLMESQVKRWLLMSIEKLLAQAFHWCSDRDQPWYVYSRFALNNLR